MLCNTFYNCTRSVTPMLRRRYTGEAKINTADRSTLMRLSKRRMYCRIILLKAVTQAGITRFGTVQRQPNKHLSDLNMYRSQSLQSHECRFCVFILCPQLWHNSKWKLDRDARAFAINYAIHKYNVLINYMFKWFTKLNTAFRGLRLNELMITLFKKVTQFVQQGKLRGTHAMLPRAK